MKKWVEENVRKYEVDLIGSGGNINHIYKYSGIKLGKPMSGAYLRKKYRLVRDLSFEQRLIQLNMKTDRADVVEHARSEEHTSELQSRGHLVCRLLLEKK